MKYLILVIPCLLHASAAIPVVLLRLRIIGTMSPSSQPHDDEELWAEWRRLYGRAVWGYVLGMVRRHDLAEDLTQEVFCRAWLARTRYREQGTARAYLLRIADRLVLDHHRRSGREINLSDEAWRRIEPAQRAGTVEEVLGQEEASVQLASTLEKLSPHQRRVLLLRYYGEFSFAEIAEMMDCPVNTALSHCRRGLLTLRGLLVESDK
jgi:RNA polymerase sigma-70 factor, ECF subfamily